MKMLRTIIRSVNTLSPSQLPLRMRKMRACYGPIPVQRFIEKETQITEPECTPELLLHLLDEKSRYYSFDKIFDTQIPGVDSLYWAHYLPNVQCLTRYILDHGEEFSNRSVLDFTGGSGATGIALLMARCKYVIINELCLACGCAAKLNALINGMPMGRFIVFPENLRNVPVRQDIVVLGEPRYDLNIDKFAKWMFQLREKNIIAYAARTNFIYGDDIKTEDMENERIRFFFSPVYEYTLPKTMSMTTGIKSVTIYQMKS